MSDLPKDWEAIVKRAMVETDLVYIRELVKACYALACKPKRELTDAEIDKLWPPGYYRPYGDYSAPRSLITAHEAKQREPERMKFRAARFVVTGRVSMCRADWPLNNDSEWIEPEQSFEVTL